MSKHVQAGIDRATYPVTEVAGREPEGLADFVGATTVELAEDERAVRLVGTGVESDGAVKFREREFSSAAQDGSMWTIIDGGDGEFRAEPLQG